MSGMCVLWVGVLMVAVLTVAVLTFSFKYKCYANLA